MDNKTINYILKLVAFILLLPIGIGVILVGYFMKAIEATFDFLSDTFDEYFGRFIK